MKQVFINGRFLTQKMTGVQRYALEILYGLDEIIDTNSPLKITVLIPKKSTITIRFNAIKIETVGNFTGHLWEQFDLPLYCKKAPLICMCNTGPLLKKRQLLTIHDAAVFAGPEWFSFLFRTWYKILWNILSWKVDRITTVSIFSKNELQKYLKIPSKKISVIQGSWEHFAKLTSNNEILSKHKLCPGKFILSVSSLNPRKNFKIIIDAIKSFEQLNICLVIVGSADERIYGKIPDNKNSNVTFTDYITDNELKALYENAACFVFPSFYEGFGLPPLEAMACGCPIVLSNASSLPEVGGEAVLYFDPKNSEAMIKQIISILQNDEVKKNLREKAKEQLEQFSWKKSAAEYMKIFQEI